MHVCRHFPKQIDNILACRNWNHLIKQPIRLATCPSGLWNSTESHAIVTVFGKICAVWTNVFLFIFTFKREIYSVNF